MTPAGHYKDTAPPAGPRRGRTPQDRTEPGWGRGQAAVGVKDAGRPLTCGAGGPADGGAEAGEGAAAEVRGGGGQHGGGEAAPGARAARSCHRTGRAAGGEGGREAAATAAAQGHGTAPDGGRAAGGGA